MPGSKLRSGTTRPESSAMVNFSEYNDPCLALINAFSKKDDPFSIASSISKSLKEKIL